MTPKDYKNQLVFVIAITDMQKKFIKLDKHGFYAMNAIYFYDGGKNIC